MTPSFLPTATHKAASFFRATVAIVALVGLALTSFLFGKEPAAVEPPFDHSVCQYPYRASNPADGCDNSDPAIVENTDEIKGVTYPVPVTQLTENAVSHNVETVEKPVEVVDNFGNPVKGK